MRRRRAVAVAERVGDRQRQRNRRGPAGGGPRPWRAGHCGGRLGPRPRGRPGREDLRTVERLGGRDPDRLADPELLRRRHLVAIGLPERRVESARPVIVLRDREEVFAPGNDMRHGLDEIARIDGWPPRCARFSGPPSPPRPLSASASLGRIAAFGSWTHPPCPAPASGSANGFAVGAPAASGSTDSGAVAKFGNSLDRGGPPDGSAAITAGCRLVSVGA